MSKKKTIYYTLDYNKTIEETMFEIVKLALPLELTMAKLQEKSYYNTYFNSITFNGITLSPETWQQHIINTKEIEKIMISYESFSLYDLLGKSIIKRTTAVKDKKVNITKIQKMFKFVEETKKYALKLEAKKKEERKLKEDKRKEFYNNFEIFEKKISLPPHATIKPIEKYNENIIVEKPEKFNIIFSNLTEDDCFQLVRLMKDFRPNVRKQI